MRLPEQPLSLCAYCAMPLDIGKARRPEGGESPHAGRIARIAEHEAYPEALGWDPAEGPGYWKGRRLAWRGKFLALTGALAMVLSVLFGPRGEAFTSPGFVAGAVALAVGGLLALGGHRLARAAVSMPLLKRPGLITDRRSETRIQGMAGSTTYYFTIEFEGGVSGEFEYAGRGSQEEPYPTNLPGVAYTRGPVLIAFKHIRV